MKQFIISEQFVILENFEKGLSGFIAEFSYILSRRVVKACCELVRVKF